MALLFRCAHNAEATRRATDCRLVFQLNSVAFDQARRIAVNYGIKYRAKRLAEEIQGLNR